MRSAWVRALENLGVEEDPGGDERRVELVADVVEDACRVLHESEPVVARDPSLPKARRDQAVRVPLLIDRTRCVEDLNASQGRATSERRTQRAVRGLAQEMSLIEEELVTGEATSRSPRARQEEDAPAVVQLAAEERHRVPEVLDLLGECGFDSTIALNARNASFELAHWCEL